MNDIAQFTVGIISKITTKPPPNEINFVIVSHKLIGILFSSFFFHVSNSLRKGFNDFDEMRGREFTD